MPIRLHQLPWGVVALALLSIAGCHPAQAPADVASARTPQPPGSGAAVPVAAAPRAADDACRLLTDPEVRRVFPGAKPGVRERSREEYGIHACVWDTDTGQFALQLWGAKGGNVDNEIRGLASGFLDPLNPAAQKNVRYETIAGVGEGAMAVVETQDEKRGILTSVALLVAQRGNQILELQSSDLPHSERATALQALTTLGHTAVDRL